MRAEQPRSRLTGDRSDRQLPARSGALAPVVRWRAEHPVRSLALTLITVSVIATAAWYAVGFLAPIIHALACK